MKEIIEMKKLLIAAMLLVTPVTITGVHADEYKIDVEGMHAAIQFRVRHVGISWLVGRFDKFDGTYTYDKDNLENSKVAVDIDVSSVNSNHEARDNHIREADYLNVEENPMARFESTQIEVTGDDAAIIHGDLTLNGVTNQVQLDTKFVGEGDDPWGGYRSAFEASATINPSDYNFKFEYGDVYLTMFLEGIRQSSDSESSGD